jgi:hypothetical protein
MELEKTRPDHLGGKLCVLEVTEVEGQQRALQLSLGIDSWISQAARNPEGVAVRSLLSHLVFRRPDVMHVYTVIRAVLSFFELVFALISKVRPQTLRHAPPIRILPRADRQ